MYETIDRNQIPAIPRFYYQKKGDDFSMKITNKEKSEIRAYYRGQYKLRFKDDGAIEAQKTPGGAWGILYTPEYTEQHLDHLRRTKKVQS